MTTSAVQAPHDLQQLLDAHDGRVDVVADLLGTSSTQVRRWLASP